MPCPRRLYHAAARRHAPCGGPCAPPESVPVLPHGPHPGRGPAWRHAGGRSPRCWRPAPVPRPRDWTRSGRGVSARQGTRTRALRNPECGPAMPPCPEASPCQGPAPPPGGLCRSVAEARLGPPCPRESGAPHSPLPVGPPTGGAGGGRPARGAPAHGMREPPVPHGPGPPAPGGREGSWHMRVRRRAGPRTVGGGSHTGYNPRWAECAGRSGASRAR